MRTLFSSLRMLAIFTLITGYVYPLSITALGQMFWPEKAQGSLVRKAGKVIGSELIGQKFAGEKYFHSRPSAVDYYTVASGASNLAVTSEKFLESVKKQREALGPEAPSDLLTNSGSGLDPHLTPEAVVFQIKCISKARNLSIEQILRLHEMVKEHTEHPLLGFIGSKKINILKLNLALDKEFP